MASSTIISLAILKANWDALGKDYLENFVPFVAECLKRSHADVISVSELQKDIEASFGLLLPQNTINTLLRRLKRRGYLRSRDGIYVRNNTMLEQTTFSRVRDAVLAAHQALVQRLQAFCHERFGMDLTVDEAESALEAYLEHSGVLSFENQTGHARTYSGLPRSLGRVYAVGAFVQYLADSHAPECEYFETLVKGHLLATALFLADPGRVGGNFRNTQVYIDSPLLVYALGYAGVPRQEPCRELLQLLRETGAKLRCFTHTLAEVRGILDACAERLRHGNLGEAYGPSIQYFILRRYEASDVELFSARLEHDLSELGILPVAKPPYIPEYVIDEKALSALLESRISYRNPMALQRDVDSLSAIARLRRGEEYYHVEECRAVLVTSNRDLVRASAEFFHGRADQTVVPLCLSDHYLTNLLWLKKPLKAPNLPRKRVIADCYAATQPSEQLWSRYMAEIDKLRAEGRITPDDVYVLRSSLDAKEAMMDLTQGEPDAFTEATVSEILEMVRSRMVAEVKTQLHEERTRREETESRLALAEAREKARIDAARKRAQLYAERLVLAGQVGLTVLLAVGSAATFPWNLPSVSGSLARYVFGSLQLILLVLSAVDLANGTVLRPLLRLTESRLSKRIERFLLMEQDRDGCGQGTQ